MGSTLRLLAMVVIGVGAILAATGQAGAQSTPFVRWMRAGHDLPVNAVAWSPDGALIASGDADWTAKIWAAGTGAGVRTLPVGSAVNAVAFSHDGSFLVTGAATVQLWRTVDGALLRTLPAIGGSVALSPDDRLLATTSGNGVALWDVTTGQLIGSTSQYSSLHAVAFSPAGDRIAVGKIGVEIRAVRP